jgi:arylsulfatase A-like enzyme
MRDFWFSLSIGLLLALGVGAASAASSEGIVLPKPPEPFTGKIGRTYVDSTAAFPVPLQAPAGAPNVLLVLTDDVGFGAASTFGGPIPTPNLSKLAAQGLVYNRFHVTAMCSPTRAALLTGRNHHAVGNGTVVDLSTGFPGYISVIPRSAATVAEVLRGNGYNTAFFGKHHNVPEARTSAAGPFDLWPTGLGFEYFYGFLGAETNQFTPALYRGTSPVKATERHGGMLDKELADDAIEWIHVQKAAAPDKPFFVYYATGSAHEPHQAPKEWIEKFRGRFDSGWDRIGAESVARQKKMGLVPKDSAVTPRPDGVAAWDKLTPGEKRINARMMEVAAAMLAYQDAQIGRVLDELQRMGQLDNTLVMFVQGDNGAAAEAGPNGGTNPMATAMNGMQESEAQLLAVLDEMGGPNTRQNYGDGWAWAMNRPFPMFKEYASHLGGTRNGLVVSWPARIKTHGLRPQYSHVTDIMPTILEAVGIPAPGVVNGITQQRIDGVSLAFSFDAPEAAARHTTQYYEMLGNQGIYRDGWLANTAPDHFPWQRKGHAAPVDYAWELYDLNRDFAQAHNIAAEHPEKLRELQALFWSEAEKNQVLPLDNRLNMARFMAGEHPQRPQSGKYVYWGKSISLPAATAAPLLHNSFAITADLVVPENGGNGVIVALGSKFGGWSFYLQDGKPVALMAATQLPNDTFRVASDTALPAGPVQLRYDFDFDGGFNAGGTLRISIDGREVAQGRIARTLSKLPEMTDTFDVGFDADTQVSADYANGGHLDAEVSKVEVQIKPS